MNTSHPLQIRVYGTRGSVSCAYDEYMKYGGNTSCAVVKTAERYLVFDAGTGILRFGKDLQAEWQERGTGEHIKIAVFLSHIHFDHIIGLPLFLGQVNSFADVTVYGNRGLCTDMNLDEVLCKLLGIPGWPVTVRQMDPDLSVIDVDPNTQLHIGDQEEILVETYPSRHPGSGLIYAVTCNGKKIAYGLDYELEDLSEDLSYQSFAKDADFLFFDGMYRKEDYPKTKGFGHTYWQHAHDVITLCNVKKAGICHYDWNYTDQILETQESLAAELDTRIQFLKEGMRFNL